MQKNNDTIYDQNKSNTVNDLKGRKSSITEVNFSVDIDQQRQSSKQGIFHNESNDFSLKLLETSVCNSTTNSKVPTVLKSYEMSPDISLYRTTPVNDRKADISRNYGEKNEIKSRILDQSRISISSSNQNNTLREKNQFSLFSSTTPKSSILNKMLTEKPEVKDSVYQKKQKTKHDQTK